MGATAVIGNLVGEENERIGKIIIIMTFIYSSVITLVLGLLTYNYSYEIANAYTEDMDTVALLKNCLESLAVSVSLTGLALSL